MTGKVTIQEIAKILVDKNGLTQREANRFATEMFAVILHNLEQGDSVKVKGLGTFKIIGVEARESVSVRTGERVVIDSHSKVTFTPDAMMKELVNKPFSQFETVVLNDGVDFEDLQEEDEEPAAAPLAEEPVAEEVPVAEKEPVVSEAPVVAEEPAAEEEPVVAEEPAAEERPVVTESPAARVLPVVETLEDEDVAVDDRRPRWFWLLATLGILGFIALSTYGGYWYGSRSQQPLVPDTVVVRDTVYMAELPDTLDILDLEEPAEEAEESAAPVAEELPAPPVAAEPQKPVTPKLDRYSEKDPRVRYGAYRIVGTAQEVTVQSGQTFLGICRMYLGPGMECYVEAYNDLPRNPRLQAGQVVKIPKLELKKRRKP